MQRLEPKVLILDDDPSVTALLAEVLKQEGYEVIESNSPKDVLFLSRQFRPDLLLLDIMMPEVDGYDVCEFFRKDPELKLTRIIVLTARDDHESRVRAYQAGADVFLPKPFELDELREIVRNHTSSKLAVDRMMEDLRNLTIHDPTASCYNRKYLEKRIAEELRRLDRSPRNAVLLYIDLDQFKQINQRYGSAFGEEVLRSIAEAIRPELRDIDLLGTYQEDSFLLLLPDTSVSGAKAVVARIQEVVSSLVSLKRKRLALHASVVSAQLHKEDKLEDILDHLEQEMDKVKKFKAGQAAN